METVTKKPEKHATGRAPKLDEIAGVNTFLESIGVGRMVPDDVRSTQGRNNNWIGTTEHGRQVMVKKFDNDPGAERLTRAVNAADIVAGSVLTPRVLGSAANQGLVAFEYIPDAQSGAELMLDGKLDNSIAEHCGEMLASFHAADVNKFDRSEHPLPPDQSLRGLSPEQYSGASGSELSMWRLLHADPQVVDVLHRLRVQDRDGPPRRVAIHGDLRLDQFLMAGSGCYLLDFEEARSGDPARDLGGFAGEWLYHAVLAIPNTLADSLPVGASATHDQVVATGTSELASRIGRVRAFCRGYFHHDLNGLASDNQIMVRSASYAGWHMIDRMMASGNESARLPAVARAAAGIGRTVLLTPEKFLHTLGLDDI